MSGALMNYKTNDKNNTTHRSHHPSSSKKDKEKEKEKGKGKGKGKEKEKEKEKGTKKGVHFTPSVSDRERQKQQHQQRHHHHQLANDNNKQGRNHPVVDDKKGKSTDGKTKHKIERLMCEWCLQGTQAWFEEGVGEEDGMRLCDECYRIRAQARGRGEMR